MKSILKISASIFLSGMLIFTSCKKEPAQVSTPTSTPPPPPPPPPPLNRPPVANAGQDQTITLPVSSVALNGSSSTDPDNNITGYQWTKIAGPSSYSIINATSIQTPVNNLVEGVYQFELKVTDAGSLFDMDTVEVTVKPDL
ncbi:MAG: hypothetical protein ABIO81_03670, partial [Ginsengibacter sp.]